MTSSILNPEIPYKRTNQGKSYFFFIGQISLAKLCIPSEARQLFRIFVLSLNEKIAPNYAVSHEFECKTAPHALTNTKNHQSKLSQVAKNVKRTSEFNQDTAIETL